MENITIEKLNSSNVDELYNLLQELAEHHNNVSKYFKGKFPSKPLDEKIAEIKEKVINNVSLVDVIRLDNNIIAFSIYFIDNNIGTLEYLIVSKKNRNKRYGRILMDNVIAYFTENNVKRIEIRIVYGNDIAKRFYEHYGFQTQSEILTLYCE